MEKQDCISHPFYEDILGILHNNFSHLFTIRAAREEVFREAAKAICSLVAPTTLTKEQAAKELLFNEDASESEAKIEYEWLVKHVFGLNDEDIYISGYKKGQIDFREKAIEAISRIGGVESKAQLKCVDCGKSDDTVKDRGAFNGVQCYDCKKNQDIEDEECR